MTLTDREAAERLRITEAELILLVRSGEIQRADDGGFREAELDRLAESSVPRRWTEVEASQAGDRWCE